MKSFLDMLFPRGCLLCGEKYDLAGVLCESCMKKLRSEPVERRFCFGKIQILCRAPQYYEGGWRDAVTSFKFNSRPEMASGFARLMLPYLDRSFSEITFVPMSPRKKRERGYNQSELLAERLSEYSGLPLTAELERVKRGEVQHSLDMAERRKNSAGMFAARSGLHGRKIVVVDDIVTTGATFCECARALLKAGAEDVMGLCAASSPEKNKDEEEIRDEIFARGASDRSRGDEKA